MSSLEGHVEIYIVGCAANETWVSLAVAVHNNCVGSDSLAAIRAV
jgi:hypothetical protein